jgi:hypothetical protein
VIRIHTTAGTALHVNSKLVNLFEGEINLVNMSHKASLHATNMKLLVEDLGLSCLSSAVTGFIYSSFIRQ